MTIFMTIFYENIWWQFLMTIFDDNFWWQFLWHFWWQFFMTCDIWDTDYITDNWKPGFMTIFVNWQLIVTLDSIRNSCDVCLWKPYINICVHKSIRWLIYDWNTTMIRCVFEYPIPNTCIWEWKIRPIEITDIRQWYEDHGLWKYLIPNTCIWE